MMFLQERFIDFVDSVLPSVSPDFRDGAKEAIRQFKKEGHVVPMTTYKLLEEFSQGDIITNIPFTYYDENGEEQSFRSLGMVLTTSCNIDNKERVIIAPVMPISSFKGSINELKDNTIFDYLYITDGNLVENYVDLGIINSYNTNLIKNGIEKGLIQRVVSLSQIGYYFFVIKMTVYLLKREDLNTLSSRHELTYYR